MSRPFLLFLTSVQVSEWPHLQTTSTSVSSSQRTRSHNLCPSSPSPGAGRSLVGRARCTGRGTQLWSLWKGRIQACRHLGNIYVSLFIYFFKNPKDPTTFKENKDISLKLVHDFILKINSNRIYIFPIYHTPWVCSTPGWEPQHNTQRITQHTDQGDAQWTPAQHTRMRPHQWLCRAPSSAPLPPLSWHTLLSPRCLCSPTHSGSLTQPT